jgi:diaminopimelate decarboxylase
MGAQGTHTGNYLREASVRTVLDSHLLLNLDDLSILETVKKIRVPEFLSFRINPGIGSSTMKSNLLAGPDAKYGVPWEQATEAYRQAKQAGVKRFGIHMMTGSNVATEDYFPGVTRKLLEIAGRAHNELAIDFEYLNIGGGFNVPYRPEEPTFDLRKTAHSLRQVFDEELKKWHMREPRLMVEPGRRVLCDAGFLVGTVHVIKHGYKTFVGIDASSSDMPRPAIYDAYHHVSVLGKDPAAKRETVNVVGTICENSDQFAKDRSLPPIEVGDHIVIHNCGAHAFAMGHNYNGKLRSAEYLLTSSGEIRPIRRAETVDDLYRTVLPPL